MTATKVTPSARKKTRRRDWRPLFLNAIATEGTVKQACAVAGISRQHAYRERQANEEFAIAWHDAIEDLVDGLERKAVEVALTGDTRMLEFLLKAHRPERYRENVHVEHTGNVTIADLAKIATE